MSMIACALPVSTSAWRSASITTWVRAESSVPTRGTASTPSHSLMTGVDSSRSCSAWLAMTRSRADTNVSNVNRPSSSITFDRARNGWSSVSPPAAATASFSANTVAAVSLGV